jgi:hypothetical protein
MKPLQEGIKKKIGSLLGQSRSYAFSSSLPIRAGNICHSGTLYYAAEVGVALWTIISIPQFES